MVPRLASKPEVLALAQDLGLKPSDNPLQDILQYVRKRVRGYLKEVPCDRLSDLLRVVAAKVDTLMVEIHSDEELRKIREEYVGAGELSFAEIESELADAGTYGITYCLKARRPGHRKFVSVIDCRGDKAWRSYFTKWHELAHLLTITAQQRLKFYRTHASPEQKDPEESVMDAVAGNIGFFDEIVRKHTKGPISFNAVDVLKARLCPEASTQATLLGFLQAWPAPCLLVDAKWGRKRRNSFGTTANPFEVNHAPDMALRAVNVTANEAARNNGLFIPRNMRIPIESAIARILDVNEDEIESDEDLSWWTSSDGGRLEAMPIHVIARRVHGGVQAFVTAQT
jgi:hypothetical protein